MTALRLSEIICAPSEASQKNVDNALFDKGTPRRGHGGVGQSDREFIPNLHASMRPEVAHNYSPAPSSAL